MPQNPAEYERRYVMTRLRRDTHDQLRGLALAWQANYERGGKSPGSPSDLGISLDWVVRELLARNSQHLARARRQTERRRYTRAAKTALGESEARAVGRGPA